MTDVLVVGAGPTGLAMAAQVHAHGGKVRVVERRTGGQDSRAIVMHPRTLEVLAPLGVAGELIRRGNPNARVLLHAAGRTAAVRLSHPGVGDTAYPFLLAIPQTAVEQVLEEHLRRVGVVIEHGIELVALSQRPDAIECELRGPHGQRQHAAAAYVVGCDGADSTVRRLAGIPFPGRPYRPTLLLADLDVDGGLERDIFHGFVGAGGILFLFPSPGTATWRLLTVGPDRTPGDLPALQAVADRFTGGTLRLGNLRWASTVRLRRGQAVRYRAGRVLLAGDAAHVHSPAGAQGMNAGIQDACNLGWKLALVATAAAGETLLDSYEAERWPVARRIRQLTDLAFLGEAADNAPLRWLRAHVAPRLLPLLTGRTIPAWAFRLAGGLALRYRGSPAVEEGRPGPRRGVRAGDRLPDGRIRTDGELRRLHELLRPPGFHVLLCGRGEDFDPDAAEVLRRRSTVPLQVHRLPRRAVAAVLGDTGTAVYLIRPDGYVAFRSRGPGLDGVTRHLSTQRGLPTPVPQVARLWPPGPARS